MTEVREITRKPPIVPKVRDQFVGHAIGKVLLRDIAGEVIQREDGQGPNPGRWRFGSMNENHPQRRHGTGDQKNGYGEQRALRLGTLQNRVFSSRTGCISLGHNARRNGHRTRGCAPGRRVFLDSDFCNEPVAAPGNDFYIAWFGCRIVQCVPQNVDGLIDAAIEAAESITAPEAGSDLIA